MVPHNRIITIPAPSFQHHSIIAAKFPPSDRNKIAGIQNQIRFVAVYPFKNVSQGFTMMIKTCKMQVRYMNYPQSLEIGMKVLYFYINILIPEIEFPAEGSQSDHKKNKK